MTDYVPRYRIVSSELGHEPQMSYLIRGAERWVPLALSGYWADPDEWNAETSRVRMIVSDHALAESVIAKARAANGSHISTVN